MSPLRESANPVQGRDIRHDDVEARREIAVVVPCVRPCASFVFGNEGLRRIRDLAVCRSRAISCTYKRFNDRKLALYFVFEKFK